LKFKDAKFGGGDYSNYDTSINCWFGWMMGQACAPLFPYLPGSFEDRSVRYVCESSIGPLLVMGGHLYWFDYKNPSGQWLTGFLNSFVNRVIMNFMFYYSQYLSNDPEYQRQKIDSVLSFAIYGDDNVWSINAKWSKYFNMILLEDWIFRYFGMTYTTPSKGQIDKPFLEWEEIEFLKRRFVRDGTACKAPLDVDSITNMLLWVQKPSATAFPRVTVEDQFLLNVETACSEWFHYGRERFDKEVSHMRSYVTKCGLPWTGKSYDHYDKRWLAAQLA
jgi:hypothetical protein